MAVSARYDVGKELDRAIALHQQGKFDRAESAYRRVLAADKTHYGALTLLGTLCIQQKRIEEGLELLRLSLAVNPLQPTAYNSCGSALRDLGRYGEALSHYEKACGLDPELAEVWYNRGVVLKQLGRREEALESYGQAIALQPAYAKAYNNRGNVLKELERYDEALRDFEKAMALCPDDDRFLAMLLNNRGIVFDEMNRYDDALADYERAAGLIPDYIDAHLGKGSVLNKLKRYDEALASYDRVLELQPDHAEAHFAKAMLKITLGEWEEGWKLYEWRWKFKDAPSVARYSHPPLWLGKEKLKGKTILLYAEQGFGDTILACRYVPLVEALGASVVLEVSEPLAGLLSTLTPNVKVITPAETLPDFDFRCPLMSLPLAFKTVVDDVPASVPYLAVDPRKQKQWQERLGAKTRPRIGLVWWGSGKYRRGKPGKYQSEINRRRDVPFSDLGKILQADGDYFCLQNEIRPSVREALAQEPRIRIYEGALDNFSDTAALIAEMDLVISVDTAVAHLAGALGKPVWILLPDPPDFMSMAKGESSPWYPTARLFRQTQPGDWAGVVARVSDELKKFA